MFFILACLFLARRYSTRAAPVVPSVADPLAYDAPIFTRDECSNDYPCPGRSVWDILWSCLATTFAVTWVSVHPNVPFLEEKSWPLLKRRIFLMCLALLAPEAMIIWAFKQWRGAVMIRETINKARPESCIISFVFKMGGFKINNVKDHDHTYWKWYCYERKKEGIVVHESILHFRHLQKLLRRQLIDFPDTTVEEIEDRSKGDALSKGVALLQITWFIFQLIARAHQHLTITELELTTAALAGLNSIMYLFWWSKPLDVRSPIVIRTKELERQLVNARNGDNELQNVGASGEDMYARPIWTFPGCGYQFRLRDYLRDSAQSIISSRLTHLLHTINVLLRLLCHQMKMDVDPEIGLQSLSYISGDASETRSNFDLQSSVDGSEDSPVTWLHFRRAVEWTWRTCKLVVKKLFYLPYLLMFLPMDKILDPSPLVSDSDNYSDTKDKMHNKPALELLFDENDMEWIMAMMFYSENAETMPLLIFSALAGAAFGSIHCAAWHFDFPSPVERILWRTASLSIVGVCLCIVGGIPIRNFLIDKRYDSPVNSKKRLFWENVTRGLETIPAIAYPLSRVSLLILALISLRNLPDSAFKTVSWTMFIPHI